MLTERGVDFLDSTLVGIRSLGGVGLVSGVGEAVLRGVLSESLEPTIQALMSRSNH